jgi:ABC-type transporter MlaC component
LSPSAHIPRQSRVKRGFESDHPNKDSSMPKLFSAVPALSLLASLALAGAASVPAAAQQQGAARASMQQCVSRVLARLARSQAPDSQVAPAVLSDCDKQLRATLAEAIQSGQAGACTVETCLAQARERAGQEATFAYRQQVRR